MEWLDTLIAVAYVAAFIKTQKKEHTVCFIAMLFSMCFFWTVGEKFSVKNDGIECLYFLILSAIWMFAASFAGNIKTRIVIMIMSTFELLCGVESFIWQFATPVLTPVIEYYIWNVVAIHVITIISISIWGVKIEKPVERIFINGKRFYFGLLSHKVLARDREEAQR